MSSGQDSCGIEKSAAKLLKPADLPDNFTRSLYKIAPFRGCAHGCKYCDGRAERYYVKGDFERDIEIRRGLPLRLELELPLVRERGMIAFGSGVTDPYQPVEATERITERCARLINESPISLPVLVMTKSNLIMRDLPIWRKIHAASGFILLISLMSTNEQLRQAMEPGSSPFVERLQTIRAFKAAGCFVGVLAMPFLPGLSDNVSSIERTYEAASAAGADFVMPGGLTLRPGRQKDFYLNSLAAYRPDLVESTINIYREDKLSGAPTVAASYDLFKAIAPLQRQFSLPTLLPHRAFASFLSPHDSLRILLRDMVELYSSRRIDTYALEKSLFAYDTWLVALRRYFRRKRNLQNTWLEERFAEAIHDGELERVIGNSRLWQFISSVLIEGARLNYLTLKLEV